jgi:hypothetical protein
MTELAGAPNEEIYAAPGVRFIDAPSINLNMPWEHVSRAPQEAPLFDASRITPDQVQARLLETERRNAAMEIGMERAMFEWVSNPPIRGFQDDARYDGTSIHQLVDEFQRGEWRQYVGLSAAPISDPIVPAPIMHNIVFAGDGVAAVLRFPTR